MVKAEMVHVVVVIVDVVVVFEIFLRFFRPVFDGGFDDC